MLSRIKEIRGVGRFEQLCAPALQFERVTIIFGENTCGKTTLADILRSLQIQDGAAVTERRSIPPSGSPQRVSLSFKLDTGKELTADFQNGVWTGPAPFNYSLRVYDDGFYHRNVFTGRSVSRENKLSLTTFVLGDEGVALAEEIRQLNMKIQDQRNQMRELTRNVFQGIEDITEFAHVEVDETLPELAEELTAIRDEVGALRARLREASSIEGRPNMEQPNFKWNPSGLIDRLNHILGQTVDSVHVEARDKMEQHLRAHSRDTSAAQNWAKEGIWLSRGDVCLFCGQGID